MGSWGSWGVFVSFVPFVSFVVRRDMTGPLVQTRGCIMTRLVGRGAWALLVCAALAPSPAMAAERWTIGLTTNGAPIEALVVDGLANAPTVLLIGGLGGSDQSETRSDAR